MKNGPGWPVDRLWITAFSARERWGPTGARTVGGGPMKRGNGRYSSTMSISFSLRRRKNTTVSSCPIPGVGGGSRFRGRAGVGSVAAGTTAPALLGRVRTRSGSAPTRIRPRGQCRFGGRRYARGDMRVYGCILTGGCRTSLFFSSRIRLRACPVAHDSFMPVRRWLILLLMLCLLPVPVRA